MHHGSYKNLNFEKKVVYFNVDTFIRVMGKVSNPRLTNNFFHTSLKKKFFSHTQVLGGN